MKRLRSWLLEQFLNIDVWVTQKYEERKFPEPPRGSVWVRSHLSNGPTTHTLDTVDAFDTVTVTRANKEWVWLSQLVVDEETGLLTKRSFKTFKDAFISDNPDDIFYRSIYVPRESPRSLWTKLLRRHRWCL